MAQLQNLINEDIAGETWYAVQKDRDDDWGTGSFDLAEAKQLCIDLDCTLIAEIELDGSGSGICVAEYVLGEDFNEYSVLLVGGDRDGEKLGSFTDELDAIRFARQYAADHESEFDPVCGGVAIVDALGNTVTDW